MTTLLAVERLSVDTLIAIGVIGGLFIVGLSYANWRRAVKAAFVILLFEGAIRKWVLPQAQELVYFLKDMVLFGAYLRYYLSPDAQVKAWRVRAPVVAILFLSAIASLSALNPNIGSPLLAVYGVKIYLFYIPLAFMIPHLFRSQEELIRQLTWYALLATPICLLGIAQFAAPGASWLNVYAQMGSETQVTTFGFGERPRITGTFSYLTGHTTFVIFFVGLHISLLMAPQKKWMRFWLLANLPLLLGNAFMGGSRAAVVSVIYFILSFTVLSFFTQVSKNTKVIGGLIIGIIIAGIGALLFFPEAMDHWTTRYRAASAGGDTFRRRTIDMQLGSLSSATRDAGGLGYGMGMSHPAVSKLRTALEIPLPRHQPPRYDSEIALVMVDLGFFGFLAWYLIRFMALFRSFNGFLRCPVSPLKPLLATAALVQVPYLIMGMVFNHTANFLLFACYGLCLIPGMQRVAQVKATRQRGIEATGSQGNGASGHLGIKETGKEEDQRPRGPSGSAGPGRRRL